MICEGYENEKEGYEGNTVEGLSNASKALLRVGGIISIVIGVILAVAGIWNPFEKRGNKNGVIIFGVALVVAGIISEIIA